MASTYETPAAVDLGDLLRRLRKQAGLSQTVLGKSVDRDHTYISRLENGKVPIDDQELGAIAGALNVTGDDLTNVLDLHKKASDLNYMTSGSGGQLSLVRAYEESARTIYNVQPSIVCGPLQTRRYAERLYLEAGSTLAQAREWTNVRMERADVILGSDIEYFAIIGEYALRYPPFEADIAIEQNRHLLKLADSPKISVQVLPIDKQYTHARYGSFLLIESDARSVVHLEQFRSSTTLTDTRYVDGYKDAARQLRRDAMSPAATTELIARITDEMERTTWANPVAGQNPRTANPAEAKEATA